MIEINYTLIYQSMGDREKQFSETIVAMTLQYAIRKGKRLHPGFRIVGACSEDVPIEKMGYTSKRIVTVDKLVDNTI